MNIRKQAGTSARGSASEPSPMRSVDEVATRLGVHPRTVRRLIARGELIAHRIGGSVRISERDLQVYLARCR